jgi:hypothetical protein
MARVTGWWLRVPGGSTVGPVPEELVLRGIRAGRIPREAQARQHDAEPWRALLNIAAFDPAFDIADADTDVSPRSDFPDTGDEENQATEIMAGLPPSAVFNPVPSPIAPLSACDEDDAPTRIPGQTRPNAASELSAPAIWPRALQGATASLQRAAASQRAHVEEAPVTPSASAAAAEGAPPLMDATDDSNDVRVILETATATPLALERPDHAEPRVLRAIAAPRDLADELTSPARRRLEEQRSRRWLAVIAVLTLIVLGLVVSLARR